MLFQERKWLGNISLENGKFHFEHSFANGSSSADQESFKDTMEKAIELKNDTIKAAQRRHIPDQTLLFSDVAHLRWILLPSEVKSQLCSKLKDVSTESLGQSPFHPVVYEKLPEAEVSPPTLGSYVKGQLDELKLPSAIQIQAEKSSWLKFVKVQEKNHGVDVKEKENIETIGNTIQTETEVLPSIDACILTRRTKEPEILPSMKAKARWRPPTKDIMKPFLEAVEAFEMIKPGDKVLVCLSGGKDSLTLLHTMKQYQYYTKGSFELGALTIDPLSSSYDPRPLIPYLKELNVPYLYEEQDIMKAAKDIEPRSICAFCSRMKRGRMYGAARREGYNVLAMGQHLDDLSESFFMSLFHNGRLRTMKANYTVTEGDLRIIRPFVYTREKQLRQFAEEQKLPVIPENCPACFEDPKERHRTKQLLAQQELLFPRLYWSLKSAMHPVMNIRNTGVESTMFGKDKINGLQSDFDGEDDDE